MKKLGLIVAYSVPGRAIGKNGGLPWHEPEDLAHFKATTLNHAIIHGRKSYEDFGKPLPKRRNIIITRQADYVAPGCEVVNDLTTAIELARETDAMPFICGGETIYRESLPLVTDCWLTEIATTVDDAHAFFPEFDESDFVETERRISGHLVFRKLERR